MVSTTWKLSTVLTVPGIAKIVVVACCIWTLCMILHLTSCSANGVPAMQKFPNWSPEVTEIGHCIQASWMISSSRWGMIATIGEWVPCCTDGSTQSKHDLWTFYIFWFTLGIIDLRIPLWSRCWCVPFFLFSQTALSSFAAAIVHHFLLLLTSHSPQFHHFRSLHVVVVPVCWHHKDVFVNYVNKCLLFGRKWYKLCLNKTFVFHK